MTDRTYRHLLGLAAVAAAVAVYLNSLANGYALDDVPIIFDNTRVHNLAAQRDIWLTPYWPTFGRELGLYRPFAIFWYALQWAAGNGSALLFHVVSVSLHAAATGLTFFLLATFVAPIAAFAGALVFAVHPVHTEAVANIVGQAELIVAVALLAACLVHATRPEGTGMGAGRRAALAALFAIAVCTKESAVVLPGLLVLCDLMQRRITFTAAGLNRYARDLGGPLVLMGTVLAAYIVARYIALGGHLIGIDAAPGLPYLKEEHRILNAFRAIPEFTRLLLYPADLSADYAPAIIFEVTSLTLMSAIGAMLLMILVVLACLTPWRPALGFPAAWFLISFITVSNLPFPIGVLVAERTLYLPSVAVAALVALLAHHLPATSTRGQMRGAYALLLAAVVWMGWRTWVRNPDWIGTQELLSSLVRDHPESYRAQWNVASAAVRRGDLDEARRWFEFAMNTYDRDPQLRMSYAGFLITTFRPSEALPLLESVVETHPYLPGARNMLAYAYLVAGRFDAAPAMIARMEQATAITALSVSMRAYVAQAEGDFGRAIGAWTLVSRNSGRQAWLPLAFLARTQAMAGRIDDAAMSFDSAFQRAPNDAARELIEAARTSFENGCYAEQALPRSPGGQLIPLPLPACDVLGDYYFRPGRGQNANPLQSATEPGLPGMPAEPSRSE